MAQKDVTEDTQTEAGPITTTDSRRNFFKPSRRTVIYTGFGGFLLFVLAVSVFFYFNFTTVEVQGDSMAPVLEPGQRLLVSSAYWLIGGVKDGDIVVIKNPYEDEVIIKRVYKTAGESVDLALVPENWDITRGRYIVPEGTIYVIGDNWPVSEDSRHYGPFDLSDVLGKVVVVHSVLEASEASGD